MTEEKKAKVINLYAYKYKDGVVIDWRELPLRVRIRISWALITRRVFTIKASGKFNYISQKAKEDR